MERVRRNELSSRGLPRLTSRAAVGRVTDRVVGNKLMSTLGSHHFGYTVNSLSKVRSVNQAADMRVIFWLAQATKMSQFEQLSKAALCNWPGERSTS